MEPPPHMNPLLHWGNLGDHEVVPCFGSCRGLEFDSGFLRIMGIVPLM